MPTYHIPRNQFKEVSSQEIYKYIRATDDPDMKLALMIAWLTGARTAQMVDLLKMDIVEDGEYLRFLLPKKKGGNRGICEFKMEDTFVKDILGYIKNKKEEENILERRSPRTYRGKLQKLNEKLWGEDLKEKKWITFHYLRHSRITMLARRGARPIEIKAFTGHRSSAYEDYFNVVSVRRFAGKFK